MRGVNLARTLRLQALHEAHLWAEPPRQPWAEVPRSFWQRQCTSLLGALLLLACLVGSADPVSGSRLLEQAHARGLAAVEFDPLSNVVPPEPITKYLTKTNTVSNGTMVVYQMEAGIRLPGARFVPFSAEDQAIVFQAVRDVIAIKGPVVISSYKEFYPDPAAPDNIRDSAPGVEWTSSTFYVVDADQVGSNVTWEAIRKEAVHDFVTWTLRTLELGQWSDVGPPVVLYTSLIPMTYQGSFTLHPLIVMDTLLAVTLQQDSGALSAGQASKVAVAVEACVLQWGIGTLVEVVDFSSSAAGTGGARPSSASRVQHLIKLEITMYRCRENATLPSPECEQQVLAAVVQRMPQSPDAAELLQAAGIQNLQVASISQRLPPAPPKPANLSADPAQSWVPWHLDRIDQHSLPLDGQFTANATGSGVHVYILSSGVMGEHEEFGYMDGSPGSRVRPGWGYQGLDPLQDCPDYTFWYGFGTYAASLCCGLKLGAAKDTIIHSVRFRGTCMRAGDTQVYGPGALPSAMDLVLSNSVRPAVVLIDTWLSFTRSPEGISAQRAVLERLDQFLSSNITVIASAGPLPNVASACDNVIASHPAVISVAAVDTFDQATAFSSTNSSCIDIWAPSGGVGIGLIGAFPAGPSNYTRIITRATGAAAIVAGVAAQYLQLHPDASPSQVRRALTEEMVSPSTVKGAGVASPANLLYTTLTQGSAAANPQPNGETEPVPGGGGGLDTGAIVAISVVGAVVLIGAAGIGLSTATRRKRQLWAASCQPPDLSDGTGWEIDFNDIEICRQPDGSEWLLGAGRYGKVYKAMKGGVQVVAVKKVNHIDEQSKALFIKEIDMMKYVSRDANITQFYGACIKEDDIMLVAEYMEAGDLRNALSRSSLNELQWYKRGKDVMLDVVKGVHFLHASHVIHRDIKSKNILLDRHGRAKLADVGLAQLFDHRDQEQASPQSSGFVGTLAWAAPEVVLGHKYTEKADVYSLGVVLWEVVTLSTPQRGCLRDPCVPLECPQGVADVIRACMQLDPALRPTAREMYSLLCDCPCHKQGEDSPTAQVANSAIIEAGSRSTSGLSEKLLQPLERVKSLTTMSSAEALMSVEFDRIEFCKNEDGSKQELGFGTFGTVYKVLLDGVHPLAAKVINVGQDPAVQMDFIREAGILWRLRHWNLVGLSCVSIFEGKGYLLMELMEGGSLFALLDVRSRNSNQRVFGWYRRGGQVALEVANGIHYLHSFRITHFDLKSGNVLLNKQLVAKLADVGLARVMTYTHHSLNTDFTGPPGTFSYMAPELMAGSRCTQSVDIYSFGVLIWEICKGQHPVRGQMTALKVPEECPQAVADLHMQCIASDPAARPSAREVVERLTQILQLPKADSLLEDSSQEASPQAIQAQASPALHEAPRAKEKEAAVLVDKPSVSPAPVCVSPASAVVASALARELGTRQRMVSPFESMRGY